MSTMIDLPADLVARVRTRATRDGVTTEDLIVRCVEQGLQQDTAPPAVALDASPQRWGLGPLPVLIPTTGRPIPALTNAQLAQLEDEEDLTKHERSLGR